MPGLAYMTLKERHNRNVAGTTRKPCTIEVMKTKNGEVVLRTLDGSGVTTLAAVLTAAQIDELVRVLQSVREP